MADMDIDPLPFEQRISILPIEVDESGDQTCCTFVLQREGHTISNVLRYLLQRFPEVKYCGYSIPHPSVDETHLRIETDGSCSPADAFHRALDTIIDMAEYMGSQFEHEIINGKYDYQPEE